MSKKGIKNTSDILFDVFNGILMALLVGAFVIPFWIVLVASLSENSLMQSNGYGLFFQGLSFAGYKYMLTTSDMFLHSIWVSVETAVLYVTLTLMMTMSAAFVLSRKYLKMRGFFNVLFMIPMFFVGGQIPSYLVIRGVGLYDSLWAYILPGIVPAYYVLLARNFFYGISASLEEAAHIDGANDLQVFIQIFLPLSMPILCTLGFMAFIASWNSWLACVLYIRASNDSLWTIQYVIRKIMTETSSFFGPEASTAPLITARNAGLIISILPLILISPLLQKYFVKGLMVGSVKG